MKERLDVSSEIWITLYVLAYIAGIEGRTEAARDYHHGERETFAAFVGNRYHIDRQHKQLIADIATAAKGDGQARGKVEAALPKFEENGWRIAAATMRIWAGERDAASLIANLDEQDSALVYRVLEIIVEARK